MLSVGARFDGRMASNVAGSFVLIGVGLIAMARVSRSLRILAIFSAVLLAVSGMAIVGYTGALRSASYWWRYTGMPIHTALTFRDWRSDPRVGYPQG